MLHCDVLDIQFKCTHLHSFSCTWNSLVLFKRSSTYFCVLHSVCFPLYSTVPRLGCCYSSRFRVGQRTCCGRLPEKLKQLHQQYQQQVYDMRRGGMRGVCRFLGVPLLGYYGPKIRHNQVYPDFAKEYFQLMADLVVIGAIAGERQGIIPPVDCDAEWLERQSASVHGVSQGPWRWDYKEGEHQVWNHPVHTNSRALKNNAHRPLLGVFEISNTVWHRPPLRSG